MKRIIDGKKYDTETARWVGGYYRYGLSLLRKANGEFFTVKETYKGTDITPVTLLEAIKWGIDHLDNMYFENEFGATKKDFISLGNGTVEHKREMFKEDGKYRQDDTLTTKISMDALQDKSKYLLNYWWVEDFDCAYIDWDKNEFVMVYRTKHYVPEDYALATLRKSDTIDRTKEN